MNMNFMKTPYLSNKQKPKNKKAFALVLSLALMGFMVLLIVTLATMVQMQMRLSRQSMIDFKAKQAAKFAAYQAMSRVQSALGPDTRVSANAMMFDPTVSSGITALEKDKKYEWWTSPLDIDRDEAERIDDPAISQNRYWLGVWDARRGYHPSLQKREEARSEYVANTVEKAITWLVSGNIVRSTKSGSDTVPAKYLPTSKLEEGDYARLVAGGSAGDSSGVRNPELDVLAPLVKLGVDPNPITGDTNTDGKETRIAWWVSDENQKASINAVASKDIISHAEKIDYRLQSLPFYSGIHGLTLPGAGGQAGPKAFDFDFNDGDDTSSIQRIRSLSDASQLDIFRSGSIPETQQLSKIFFHSVSFNTKGLIVNVRDGGLKKDLSLGLTRKDFGNETEVLDDSDNTKYPEYFERPYGVAGYDFKTTAYPLQHDKMHKYNFDPNKANQPNRILGGKGHMFGPQMYGNEYISDPDGLSTITYLKEMFDDSKIAKDGGGPLWDQLRSYYNLRAENLADNATLNERVQTDDRIGLKPVVKRFQVFYVPTFVNYGGLKYGLRLHIMPLLILYNPYDTKIKGDTYYAIRVWAQFKSPVGAFRFAIGYETNGYFQCLRDLRTEAIPSLADQVTKEKPDPSYLQQFYVPFRLGANFWSKKENQNNKRYFSPANIQQKGWWLSTYTRFHRGFSLYKTVDRTMKNDDNTIVSAFPLGYGTKVTRMKSAIKSAWAKNDIPITETESNWFRHWKGIVDNGNIVPSQSVAATLAGNTKNYAARVAKIPLYLNNILYAVTHGTYSSSINNGPTNDNYRLFISQRSIDARINKSQSLTDSHDDANLFFMAYDANGIEPGKAKIFSMKKIVSYVGDPFTGSQSNNDGPNGVIEKSDKVSLYETKDAMMHGLDDGGKLGGCFYVDIPHPESEHSARFSEKDPLDWRSENKYIMFDLQEIADARCRDFNGAIMNPSINNLYIDMQDIQATYPSDEGSGYLQNRVLGATFNMTPIGYGIGGYNADYSGPGDASNLSSKYDFDDCAQLSNPIHRHELSYMYLHLDIWIWKREGFKFQRFSNGSQIGTEWQSGDYHVKGPTLVSMVGSRFYSFKKHSFPDPSQKPDTGRSAAGYNNYATRYNFHCPGWSYTTKGNKRMSLAALGVGFGNGGIRYNVETDTSTSKSVDRYLANLFKSRVFDESKIDQDGDDSIKMEPIGRARFYINWLTLNPRRHSANYWRSFDKSDLTNVSGNAMANYYPKTYSIDTNSQGASKRVAHPISAYEGLADLTPKAIKRQNNLNISYSNFRYEDELHAAINNTNGTIPYGMVFSLPYASENEPGHEPFFNSRVFVNSNLQASGYYADGSGINASTFSDITKYNTISRVCKFTQSINQAYGERQSGDAEGMSNVGYTIHEVGGYVRTGLKETVGTDQAPLFHILRKTEVVSNPANLASAALSFGVGKYFGPVWYDGNTSQMNQRSISIQANELQHPSIAIGNSLCPSRISPERPYHVTWIDGAGITQDKNQPGNNYADTGKYDSKRDTNYYEDRSVLYDVSWLLNDLLWDEYYFSTLPYRNDEAENTVHTSLAIPQNPRIQYYVDKDEQLLISDLKSANVEDQFEQNAAKMWINGAFNVNSTSIDAWKVILSTYYGTEMKDYTGRSTVLSDYAPFARWAAPFSATEFTDSSTADTEDVAFQGFRALSDNEIELLATAIVEHVKDRGPFYSMSHFVNRVSSVLSAEQRYTENYIGEDLVPLPNGKQFEDRKNLENEYADNITYRVGHAQKGVLQAAIDSTSINKAFHEDENTIISVDNTRNMAEMIKEDGDLSIFQDPRKLWENWRGAIGPQATGIPTYLMQQDLLSKLGSFLTVRSDTFKIRAYGEVRNPVTGIVEGKAWCEVVIQRTPDYIDTNTADQEPWRISGREVEIGYQANIKEKRNFNEHLDELSEINKELGRRFKVVSFRWLNEKEI